MKVLVTGAAGFIGYHVAQRLLHEGSAVVGFDNLNSYYLPKLKETRLSMLRNEARFEFIRGDLEDKARLAGAFARGPFDAVVHLAAQAGVRHSIDHPDAYVQSNVIGFLNILEECRARKVPHLIYASSSSVYGLNSSSPFSTSDNVDHPVSLYAATKKTNELMAHSYSHLYNLPTTGLRFFTVYGPWGRPDMAYFKFTEAILAQKPIEVFNHGELWRDFTYIDDIVEGLVRLLPHIPHFDEKWDARTPNPATSSAPYRIYNIGNHQPVRLIDFIRTLERALGRKAVLAMRPMQPGDVFTTCADTQALQKIIGFAPNRSLKNGLEMFVSWYRSYFISP